MREYQYKILENMPYQEYLDFYKDNLNDLRNTDNYLWYEGLEEKKWQSLNILPNNPLYKKIENFYKPLGFDITHIQYFKTVARYGFVPIHIDHGVNGVVRRAAINIPIQAEGIDQYFIMGTEELQPNPEAGGKSLKYHYIPEVCSFYNSRKPWVLNTQIPHGFANWSDKDRIILSVGFMQDYDFVVERLPKEWF